MIASPPALGAPGVWWRGAEVLADAVNGARWMAERDHIGFCPHIGIAAGQVVVGYVGTPLNYNCSVYGEAVTLAQRCCQIGTEAFTQASMILPASVWGSRKLAELLTKRKVQGPDGGEFELDVDWRILPARKEVIKGGPGTGSHRDQPHELGNADRAPRTTRQKGF
jgi:hypothetical protein